MKTTSNSTGLRYWMQRVLDECDKVAADFAADPVHDLRVSLRRCRSLADGMIAVDPDPDWKAMKKAGKELFQKLGALRDIQIMMEWIEKLELQGKHASPIAFAATEGTFASDDPLREMVEDPATKLLGILKIREAEQKREAHKPLEEFDRKHWKQWGKSLPGRAARIRPGNAVFKHLALERWTTAHNLHRRAMLSRSEVALHTLRIGIKRFRYIVENFLPEEHGMWSKDLKHMQDLLGEVHDLDVLWAMALSSGVLADESSRQAWHEAILQEREKRIEKYRERTTGPDSLWNTWRARLPQDKQIQEIANQRIRLWAKALDSDFAHAERVARLARDLYEGLSGARLFAAENGTKRNGQDEDRTTLYMAALLHDVGKVSGKKGHHKESFRLITKQGVPLGWKAQKMAAVAAIARFHCGGLPTRSHELIRGMSPEEQKKVIWFSAILRLANAFDSAHDGRVKKLRVEGAAPGAHQDSKNGSVGRGKNDAVILMAEGFVPESAGAQAVAAERYLLETLLHRPIIVKPMKTVKPSKARQSIARPRSASRR